MMMNVRKNFVGLPLLIALACSVSLVWGHCGDVQPRGNATGFRFEDPLSPDFDAEHMMDYDFTAFSTSPNEVLPFQDTDNFARDRQGCSNNAVNNIDPSPFYARDSFTGINISDTILDQEISCEEALDCKKDPNGSFRSVDEGCLAVISQVEAQLPAGEFIPSSAGDVSACCGDNYFRFRLDRPLGPVRIEVAPDFAVNVELTLTSNDLYNASDAQRFADLCEELFVCTQYLQFDDRRRCIIQSGSDRFCPPFAQRSLCFEDMYVPVPSDQAERDYRTQFIISSCLGFNATFVPDDTVNGDFLVNPLPIGGQGPTGILNTLLGSVESMCNSASARSREILYVASADCKSLINCENDAFKLTGTPAERDPDDISTAFSRCGSYTEDEITSQLSSCNSLGDAAPPSQIYAFDAKCPNYLQSQFASFPPDYPNADGSDPDYFRIILDGGSSATSGDSRTDASVVGSLKISLVAAKAAVIVATAFKDALPRDIYYVFWRNAAWIITTVAVEIINDFIILNDFHDANVDGAEIEAAYENSRQLLDGSAAVFDAVRCRISPIDSEGPKWGHGCDSIDNDCNRLVDECEEDHVLPIVDTTLTASRCSSQWFKTIADAKACVDSTAVAYDDCDPSVAVTSVLVDGTNCNSTQFDVVATTSRCGQVNGATVTTKVAAVPPTVSCSTKDGKNDLVLLATGASVLEDIGLTYTVENSSGGGCVNEKNVTVKVFSNELEDLHSQKMAVLYQYGDTLERPGLFVSKGLCQTINNGQCVMDPSLPAATYARVYTIQVTAADEAGNVGSATCRAIILPTNLFKSHQGGNPNATVAVAAIADLSAQRFELTDYSHTFVG